MYVHVHVHVHARVQARRSGRARTMTTSFPSAARPACTAPRAPRSTRRRRRPAHVHALYMSCMHPYGCACKLQPPSLALLHSALCASHPSHHFAIPPTPPPYLHSPSARVPARLARNVPPRRSRRSRAMWAPIALKDRRRGSCVLPGASAVPQTSSPRTSAASARRGRGPPAPLPLHTYLTPPPAALSISPPASSSRCSGGQAVLCARGTFNNLTGAQDQGACEPCATQSATLSPGAKSAGACVCEAGFYDAAVAAPPSAGPRCVLCPVGTRCLSRGMTLRTLSLDRGVWRVSENSSDVRRMHTQTRACIYTSASAFVHLASPCTRTRKSASTRA